jgi:hypothetical protein
MATLLTSSKMHPALAARVDASVRGRGRTAVSPRVVALARLGFVVAAVALVYSVVGFRRGERHDLTQVRTELLAAARKHAASLTDADRASVGHAEQWLVSFSRSYDGEIVAGDLRAPGALAAILSRPIVYVRGPIGDFSSPRHIHEAAAASMKDAFVLCLLAPPASRAEKALLGPVRLAYAGGATMEQRTSHVRRLHDAEAGLPFLTPAWAARVEAAAELAEVTKLKRDFERARVDAATQAARARLLLVVMDEPGEGSGPTELDGERAHHVRVGLVDLASETTLLSTRKLVDPTWISLAKRSEYAVGLDGCGLALDVHDTVRAPAK